jgi:hypothetical protein
MSGAAQHRFVFRNAATLLALAMICALLPRALHPQAAGRIVGTLSAISGNSITVKSDAGAETQITVASDATLKRLEPGQKDLSAAPAIQLSDLAVGDRVLVRLDPAAPTPTASMVIAMKKADVAQAHQKDAEAWQRGVAGLVKKVDPTSGDITAGTGAGPTAKTVIIKTTSSTRLLRYAPASVNFADAKPAPIADIQPGDQIRARGTKNSDGAEIAADEVVSGTFRNIAGTISAIDPAASTLTVKDLGTKKQVTIHFGSDVQMRRIPERMAQMLAAHLKGAGGAGPAAGNHNANGAPRGGAVSQGAQNAGSGGRWAGQAGGNGFGADPQRMLAMAPSIKLTDLAKGQAVMVVATSGANDVKAITLLAGVEPLLEAPAVNDLLSNWSMGGGGGAEAAAGTP